MSSLSIVKREITEYVESEILPRYGYFDAAHGLDHVWVVIKESLHLASYFDVDINMVYVSAAYHDIGLVSGRENHHLVSSEKLINDTSLPRWFSQTQRKIMADAVEDHRASSRREPRSIYGKIIAEADRDIIPQKIIRRAVQYGLDNYPSLNYEEQFARFCSHMKEKYSEDGYIKLWIPFSRNAEGLRSLRKDLSDADKLRCLFNKIYIAEGGLNK